ncbi:MAG: hypothetical protein E7653_01225 [Ruminococcaceae bacterium]|nr:hypothetical protein [Oscillospiraceae bacterium]
MIEKRRLGSAKKRERLEAKNEDVKFEYRDFSTKKRSTLRRVYKAYIVTTLCTLLAVMMLFLFGVGSNGDALAGRFSLVSFADKIGRLVLKNDFSDISSHASYNTDEEQTIPSVNDENVENSFPNIPSIDAGTIPKDLYEFDYSKVPEGHTPIVPMDLSLIKYGSSYINNSTGYKPNVQMLIEKNLKGGNGYEQVSLSNKPLVLIVHTHGTEAYSENGALYYPSDESNYARSEDTRKNVVAIGKTVAEILNSKGIPTAHCTVMHDALQYKDSYARAEETIRKYLEEYPSIKLVIDIHRDSIVRSNGELIRPVAEYKGEAAAQLMCVVGSDWGGQECANWENNLSLALKLREKLNQECDNICRPTNLKPSTYNQEISKFSLLIEVGSSGNSLSEAQRSAALLGEKLCELMKEI